MHHRVSKVCRGLSHEFGVVRLYRTFSLYSVTGETRSAGCLGKSSGWFKHSEHQRTYSNHNITELARCGGSMRFDVLVSLNLIQLDSKVCRGLSQEFGVVQLYRTFSSYSVTYANSKIEKVRYSRTSPNSCDKSL